MHSYITGAGVLVRTLAISAFLLVSVTAGSAPPAVSDNAARRQENSAAWVRENFIKYEYRIPMRDGIRLFTIVYVPRDAAETNRYPMLMMRTCYSIPPYGPDAYAPQLGPNPFVMRDKYIFVSQDVRGRYMSAGLWTNVRPQLTDEARKRDPKAIDESTDTYDTIEWLLANVRFHNGRVGQHGISYPGFFTTAGALSRHPALVASSPQAPVTDFFFEDFHHNGALTQAYFYTYPIFGIQSGGPTTSDWWAPKMVQEGRPDDYSFQLALGPLKTTTEKYYKDNFFWRELTEHPDYDRFWQARAIAPHLKGIRHAVMTVGGWFDAEDLYGPLKVYKTIEKNNPGIYNTIVMGPFSHGGWAAQGKKKSFHGDLYFGEELETKFQRDVEAKFFRHFLKGDGSIASGLPDALMFDTGAREWRSFDSWPATNARAQGLYLHADGALSLTAPAETESFSEYISDPKNPVPSRCLVPTIEGLTMYQYMSDDQRCFSTRPDVVEFQTAPLTESMTLGGEIMARLHVSVTGTDADFVVKLIDVYPSDEPDHPDQPHKNIHLAGYQALVRGEIMRGRFRDSFENPAPFTPGQVTEVSFALQDVLHTFKKGHRLMVQVQSSWFPAFDRNPQKYVPNIYNAEARDFIAATHRIWHDRTRPSQLTVQVLPR
ncbi:MAG: CocE/NonD family hydrolase [Blastocatellia bacterium]